MLAAVRNATRFLWLNATVRDPRSSGRHNWRWVLFVLVDTLLFERRDRRTARNGTLVILVNRLGDAIVSKALIDALRHHFGEPLTVLGDKNWSILADNIYADTQTVFIDERRFRLDLFYRVKTVRWLRRQNFRRAICFMHHRLEMRDDALVALSGADERIVLALPPSFFKFRWYPWIYEPYHAWMTQIVPTPEITAAAEIFDAMRDAVRKVPHAFDRHRRFYAALTGGGALPWRRLLPDGPSPRSGAPYAILSFGASSRERCWPLPAYVDLAARLVGAGTEVIFVGGPAEVSAREDLVAMVANRPELSPTKVSVLVNELSFAALIRLYAGAACLVGTDTGGSHLAMWLGVPLVTILHADRSTAGYERLGDFFPYPADIGLAPYRAVWTSHDEFRRTGADGAGDRVWAAVRSLLSERAPS